LSPVAPSSGGGNGGSAGPFCHPNYGFGAWIAGAHVHSATVASSGKPVVLKLVANHGDWDRERKALAALQDSPHVVDLVEAHAPGLFEARGCLVLEPLGVSLSEWLDGGGGRLGELVLKGAAKEVLSAVHFLHGRGIVHLDLKPQQFCLHPETQYGVRLKLVDFDGARSRGDGSRLDRATAEWAAPEVLAALRAADGSFREAVYPSVAIDAFGAGLVVVALLTRRASPAPGAPLREGSGGGGASLRRGAVALGELSESARGLVEPLLREDPAQRSGVGVALGSLFFTGGATQVARAVATAVGGAEGRLDAAAAARHGEGMAALSGLGGALGELGAELAAGLSRLDASSARVVGAMGEASANVAASARALRAADATSKAEVEALVKGELRAVGHALRSLAAAQEDGGAAQAAQLGALQAQVLAELEKSAGSQAELGAAIAAVASAVDKVGRCCGHAACADSTTVARSSPPPYFSAK
jgi:hypothetical protein